MESRANYDSKKKSIDFVRWCKCEQKCFKMTAKAQEKCCRRTDGKCVTEGDLFKAFVTNKLNSKDCNWRKEDVLMENRPYWCVLEDPDKCPTEDSEEVKKRQLRRKAYGLLKDPNGLEKDLGDGFNKDWQHTLPSCVVWSVRLEKKFRAKSGLYTGYFPGIENPEDILQLAVKAADNFNQKIENIKTVVGIVEQDQKKIGPLSVTVEKGVKVELISMGIVNTIAAFEAFAYDALWTSFEIGFSKTVHCTRNQFDTWIISRINDDVKRREALYPDDNRFWESFVSGCKNPKIKTAFKNWTDSKNRTEMYGYYALERFPESESDAKNVIAVTRTIVSDSSSKTFRSCEPVAIKFRKKLSTLLYSQPPFSVSRITFVERLFEFFLKKNCSWVVHLPPYSESYDAPLVEIKELSFEQLCFVSNLFYGIRCRLAHGNVKRTTEEGKLNMEMEDYDWLLASNREYSDRVRTHFKNLLEEAKKEKMDVDYYLFNTMQSFYKYFVQIVGQTCACVVYFMLCQLRFVDCSRGKAFQLVIETLGEAIKYAKDAPYESILPDAQVTNQPSSSEPPWQEISGKKGNRRHK